MTDTIMLEAPARGWRISDLADGQGRILRLHDLTASSLGHTSHANPDRKPINVANQTESPTRTGGRVTIERKPDEGDGPAVIHRLNDERDQRWQNLIAGFLVHASRGVVRHDGRNDRERVRIIRPTLGDATEQILQSFEQSHGKPPISKTNAFTIPADIGNEHEPAEREKQADGKPEQA